MTLRSPPAASSSPRYEPATVTADDYLPARRLHWAMRGALMILAVVLSLAGWGTWQRERERTGDAEVINLAGGQRTLTQQIALIAVQPSPDDGRTLESTLEQARDDALKIESLLGIRDSSAHPELPATLTQAMQRWKDARERLGDQARHLGNLVADGAGTPGFRAAGARLRADADQALQTAETMVEEIQRHIDAKGAVALHRLVFFAAFGAVLLLALALGVIEPAARLLRRQHARAAGQALLLERMALVAERTHNVVVITDADRCIVWVNEAFTRLSGYTLGEAIGRKPSELLQTQATDTATVARLRHAMDEGRGVRVELLNRSRGGIDYWIDIDVQPLHDGQGKLTGFIAVETEITEQVLQRQRLNALLEALPTGLIERDASGTIVEANAAALQVLGTSREALLGRRAVDEHWQAVHDDLSPYPREQHPSYRSLREGESVRGDSMGITTPQGEQRWLLINSEPLRDAIGEVSGVVTCFVDVTEHRAQRTLLELALQAADIGTWQWRVDNDERHWSVESCAMLGYSVEEFAPSLSRWRDRIHPEDRPGVESLLQAHLGDPTTPYRCELRVRHRSGHWIWVQILGAVVERDLAGKPIRMVGVQINISERMHHEQQLKVNALTDTLTGLPNRLALMHQLGKAIERRRIHPPHHFGVLFLDFDRFKQVNDSLGHAAGDELLRQIALRLQGTLRTSDAVIRTHEECAQTASRLGGDEFVVLLEGLTQANDVCFVAERLLQVLALPYEVQGHRVHAGASIGVVTSDDPFEDADSLLRDADTAMYEAKQAGRGRWVRFEPRMHTQVVQRASVEADLRDALERDELFVVYQPVLVLDDPRGERGCAGVEALVRWRHPVRGIVPPIQFISVAEDSGLIGALGQFVMETACRQFMRWRLDLGAQAPSLLAVNLSIAQLRQFDLVDQVRRTLLECSMPAAALQLEVTESLAAQDPLVQARLRELKALGVKLALDDFGTGYSSLACLHQLPVDTVKIDRSFVVEAELSEYHRALIEATVKVARTLRMATVAEGIETLGQAELVASLGCDRGQGYLYSKPLESDALTNWLVSRTPQGNVVTLPMKTRTLASSG